MQEAKRKNSNFYLKHLNDPSLVATHPERLPTPPPAFFKHTSKLPEPQHGFDPEANSNDEHPFGPPRTAYKLLSSDYDWLTEPMSYSAEAACQQQTPGSGAMPTPKELSQTRFFARARIVLVKLRQQVDETVEAALAQGAAELLEHGDPLERIKAGGGGGQPGAQGTNDPRSGLDAGGVPRLLSSIGNDTGDDSAADAATPKGPSLLAGVRPPPVARAKGTPGKPAAAGDMQRSSLSGTPVTANNQPGSTIAKGGAGGRRTPPPGGSSPVKPGAGTGSAGADGAGMLPPEVAAVAELVRSKLGAMFEDTLFDVMEQLWGAFSVAGHTRSQVASLAHAMSQREAEIEELANRKAAALEREVASLKQQLLAAQETIEADRLKWQSALLTSHAKAEHLQVHNRHLQTQLSEKEVFRMQLDAARAALATAEAEKEAALKEAAAAVAERVEGYKLQARKAQEALADKEEALAKASQRMAEQLVMLETAFVRRDHEVSKAKQLENTLTEVIQVLVEVGEQPAGQWAANMENEATHLSQGEVLDGEFGMAKGLLAAARKKGAANMISAFKKGLPEVLPRYDPPVPAEEEEQKPAVPTISRLDDAAVRPAVPELWQRLLRAPLTETLSVVALNRHILELYGVKETADNAADAAGAPRQGIHSAIYKHYLQQETTVEGAEHRVAILIQSLRACYAKSERACLFGQFLGMRPPTLPEPALQVYLAIARALRSEPPSGQPAIVEEDAGAWAWVHPVRWRALLLGPLGSAWDGVTTKSIIKRIGDLKPEAARSKSSFGMHDMDAVLRVMMDGWVTFYYDAAQPRLEALFREHDLQGNGVFSVYEFKDLATNVNMSLNISESRALDLFHECLADSVAAARAGNPKALGRLRGSITAESFAKVALKHRLLGSLPTAAGGVEVSRLAKAVELFSTLIRLFVSDIRREGCQTLASDRLESEVAVLEQRVRAAQTSGIDVEGIADCWSAIASVSRMLLQVHDEYLAKQAEFRAAAAHLAAVREERLREEAARAQQSEAVARQERLAAEAAAAQALERQAFLEQEQQALRAAAAAAVLPHDGQLPGVSLRAIQEEGGHGQQQGPGRVSGSGRSSRGSTSSPTPAGSRPISATSHGRKGLILGADTVQQEQDSGAQAQDNEDVTGEGGDGDEGVSMEGGMLSLTAALTRSGALSVSEADRLRNELARAVRRAEAAENKMIALRSQTLEQGQELESMKMATSKKSRAAARRARQGTPTHGGGSALPYPSWLMVEGIDLARDAKAEGAITRLLDMAGFMHGLTSALAQLQGLLLEHSSSIAPAFGPGLKSHRRSCEAQGPPTHQADQATGEPNQAAEYAGDGAGAEAAGEGAILWPTAAQVPGLQERLRSEAGGPHGQGSTSQGGSPMSRHTRSSSPLEQRLSAMGANNPAAARVAAFNAAMGGAAVLPLPPVLDASEDGSGSNEPGAGTETATQQQVTQGDAVNDDKVDGGPEHMGVQGSSGKGHQAPQVQMGPPLAPVAAPLARQDSVVLSLIEQGRAGAWELSEVMGEQALAAGHPHQTCFYTGAAQGAAFAGSLPLELLVAEVAGARAGGDAKGAGYRFGSVAVLPGRTSGGGTPTAASISKDKVAGVPRLRARRTSQSEGPPGFSRLGSGRLAAPGDTGSPPSSAGGARRLAALRAAAGGDGLGSSRNLGGDSSAAQQGTNSAENTPRIWGSFRARRTSAGDVNSPRAPLQRAAGGSGGGVQQGAEGLVGVGEEEEAGAVLLGQLVQVCGSVARYALQAAHLAAAAQAQAEQAVAAATQMIVPTPEPPFSLEATSMGQAMPGVHPTPPEANPQQTVAAGGRAAGAAAEPALVSHPSSTSAFLEQQAAASAAPAVAPSIPAIAAQGQASPFAAMDAASEAGSHAQPDTPGRGGSARVSFPVQCAAAEAATPAGHNSSTDAGFLTTKPLHLRPSAPLLNLGRFTSDPYLGRKSDPRTTPQTADLGGMEQQQHSRRSNLMYAHDIAHDVAALVNGPGGLPLSASGPLTGHMDLSISGQPAMVSSRLSTAAGLAPQSSIAGGGPGSARVQQREVLSLASARAAASPQPTSRPSSARVSPSPHTMLGKTSTGGLHDSSVPPDPAASGQGQASGQQPPVSTLIRLVNLSDLDPSELLCRSFRLSPEDIQELSWGVLGAVKAAGGYPVVTTQGHLVSQDGRLIAPTHPEHELPDPEAQAEALRRLYIATAALIVSQHSRGQVLQRLEADCMARFTSLQAAAARLLARQRAVLEAQASLEKTLRGLASYQKHTDLLAAALASLGRQSASCEQALRSATQAAAKMPSPGTQAHDALQLRAQHMQGRGHSPPRQRAQGPPDPGTAGPHLTSITPQFSPPGSTTPALHPSPSPHMPPADQQHQGPGQHLQAAAHSLILLEDDLAMARTALDNLRGTAKIWGAGAAAAAAAAGVAGAGGMGAHPSTTAGGQQTQAASSGDLLGPESSAASGLVAVQELLQELLGQADHGIEADAQYAALLSDLRPGDLFQRMLAAHGSPAAAARHLLHQATTINNSNTTILNNPTININYVQGGGGSRKHLNRSASRPRPATASGPLVVPREYEPLPTPPTSPKGSRNERPHQQVLVGGAEGAPAWPDLALYAQEDDPRTLPPGEALATLSPSLQARSIHSPPRYTVIGGGGGAQLLGHAAQGSSGHGQQQHQAGSAVQHGQGRRLFRGGLLEPLVVPLPPGRYTSRPHTARQYIESVIQEGYLAQQAADAWGRRQVRWPHTSGHTSRSVGLSSLFPFGSHYSQLAHHPHMGQQGYGVAQNSNWSPAEAQLQSLLQSTGTRAVTAPGLGRPWPWWSPSPRELNAFWEAHVEPAAGSGAHLTPLEGHTSPQHRRGSGHTSPSGSPQRSRSRSPPHTMPVLLAAGGSAPAQQSAASAPPQGGVHRPAGPRDMSEAVEAGAAAAAATKLARARALAPSPELAGWSDAAPPVLNPQAHTVANVGGKGAAPLPVQALNALSTAAIASGALAGGGPPTSPGRQSRGPGGGAGALRRSISPGPSLFPGMRVDSSGKVVVVPPASPRAGGATSPTAAAAAGPAATGKGGRSN